MKRNSEFVSYLRVAENIDLDQDLSPDAGARLTKLVNSYETIFRVARLATLHEIAEIIEDTNQCPLDRVEGLIEEAKWKNTETKW